MASFKVKELTEEELYIARNELENNFERNYMMHSAIDLRLKKGILKKAKLVVYQAVDPLYKSFMFATPMASDVSIQSMSATWDPNKVDDDATGQLFSNIPNWNWNEQFLVFSSTWDMKKSFDKLFGKKCIIANTTSMTTYLPGHRGIHFSIGHEYIKIPRLPPGYRLAPLPASAAIQMLSRWEYNFAESVEGLAERLEAYKGMAIFYQEDCDDNSSDKLVSWACQHMSGAIGITFTLPEHRRKGLGSAVTLTLAKQIIEEGRAAFLMVDVENSNSLKFHKKIGFKIIGETGFSHYIPNVRNFESIVA